MRDNGFLKRLRKERAAGLATCDDCVLWSEPQPGDESRCREERQSREGLPPIASKCEFRGLLVLVGIVDGEERTRRALFVSAARDPESGGF